MKKILAVFFIIPLLLCGCAIMQPQSSQPSPRTSQEEASKALLEAGQIHFIKGDFNLAAESYRAALKETPSGLWGARARLGLARVEQAGQRYKEALDLAEQASREPGLPNDLQLEAMLLVFNLEVKLNMEEEALSQGGRLLDSPPVPLSDQQRLDILENLLKICRASHCAASKAMLVNQVFKTTQNPDAAWLNRFSTLASAVYPDYAPTLKGLWPEREGQLMAEFIWAKYYFRIGPMSEARNIIANLADTPGLSPVWREALQLADSRLSQALEGGMEGHVGLILPMSGNMAQYGRPLATAVEMGLGILSGQDGLVLFMEDDMNSPEEAALAVDKLVSQHNVLAIIGPMGVKTSQAAAERAEALEVPLIALSQGQADILTNRRFVFQNYFSPEDQVRALLDALIMQRGKYRVAVLAPSNNFGQSFAAIIEAALIEKGGELAGIRYYHPSTTDFYSIVQELGVNYRFDALFVADGAERSGSIVTAIADNKLNCIIMGPNLWHSSKFLLGAGAAGNGVMFANAFDASVVQNRVETNFVNDFKQVYGRTPNVLDAQGYDAGLLLRHVLAETTAPSRLGVALNLHGVQRFPALCGMLTVEPNGKIAKPLTVFTVDNGRFVPLFRSEDSF